jgi:hypothetical protein
VKCLSLELLLKVSRMELNPNLGILEVVTVPEPRHLVDVLFRFLKQPLSVLLRKI